MEHRGPVLLVCLVTSGGGPVYRARVTPGDENFYRGDPPPPPHGAPPPPGYGPPPGWGPPPGYPPPGYPPPGYWPPPGYPAYYGRRTNTLAILALVMAFVFAPAGLVCGIVARRQIGETGEDGDGLALAGIIVGGIVTALYVLMILGFVAAFSSAPSF
jgi:hypothetical protein